MEKRITSPVPVLDAKGRPRPGWANEGLLQYQRSAIKAPPWRIKEWDWYQVSDQHHALQFTLGHASYAGQVGIMLFDFEQGKHLFTKDKMLVLPFGSLGLAASAEQDGTLLYDRDGMFMRFEKQDNQRTLTARCEGFEAEIRLIRRNPHALVISIPFNESPTAFYYNHKLSCMAASGYATANGIHYAFEENAWGLLDWGRGVWPFHNEWYWSSASGLLDGEVFGFNLGCGFGNTSQATENCLFYRDGLHKLGAVKIETGDTYMAPWHLHDTAGRLDVTLCPVYDRETKTKLLWVDNNTHQLFGRFTGKAVLDDGTTLQVEGITGFAEHAVNNW